MEYQDDKISSIIKKLTEENNKNITKLQDINIILRNLNNYLKNENLENEIIKIKNKKNNMLFNLTNKYNYYNEITNNEIKFNNLNYKK